MERIAFQGKSFQTQTVAEKIFHQQKFFWLRVVAGRLKRNFTIFPAEVRQIWLENQASNASRLTNKGIMKRAVYSQANLMFNRKNELVGNFEEKIYSNFLDTTENQQDL